MELDTTRDIDLDAEGEEEEPKTEDVEVPVEPEAPVEDSQSARVRKNLTEKLEPLPRDELCQTDQCGVRKRKSPTRLGSQFVPKNQKTSSKENMERVSRNLGSVTSQVLDIN